MSEFESQLTVSCDFSVHTLNNFHYSLRLSSLWRQGTVLMCAYRLPSIEPTRILEGGGLLSADDIRELSQHMDDVLAGKETAPGFPKIDPSLSESQRVAAFSRIHNAHRVHALHERFLLHPRILDVIEQLSGPDVLALQSMAFFKEPGQPGQG